MATCRPHHFENISSELMDQIISELQSQDEVQVTGNNPWTLTIQSPFIIVMVGQHLSNTLTINVANRPILVPCNRIYNEIKALIDEARNNQNAT